LPSRAPENRTQLSIEVVWHTTLCALQIYPKCPP
jgi:hypothetical protein